MPGLQFVALGQRGGLVGLLVLEPVLPLGRALAVAELTERARRMRTVVSAEALADATRIARERATVSPVIAARLMVSLAEIAARVSGYAMVLGEDSTKGITAKVAELRNQIEPLCNDTVQRASMLELT